MKLFCSICIQNTTKPKKNIRITSKRCPKYSQTLLTTTRIHRIMQLLSHYTRTSTCQTSPSYSIPTFHASVLRHFRQTRATIPARNAARDLHGNGHDGNPADSAGFPREWKVMLRESRGNGNIILRDSRGNVCSFYPIMSCCNQPLATY